VAGIGQLKELLTIVHQAGYGDTVEVDLSIARGLDYYTGTIYETFVHERENFGSVMSGGRYDDLLGMFLKNSVPAVGICVGIDRLISVLDDMGLLEKRTGVTDVYMVLFDQTNYGELAGLAREIRRANVNVELSLSASKLGKQFKAAEKKGCRWVVIAGEQELASGEVKVKDLESGHQEHVPRADIGSWLAGKIAGTS
jgi:histidyl-tRNA synthetase